MKTKIYDQHAEHTEWLSKLTFYNDEIKIMQKRLEEVGTKNTSAEVQKEVEHFQNQFIIQTRNIDELNRKIRRDEKMVQNSINQNPIASDHRTTEDHEKEREMVTVFENNFNNIRAEFKSFVAKWI